MSHLPHPRGYSIEMEDAVIVLRSARGDEKDVASESALQVLQKERDRAPIITFCRSLDNAIGGGVPLGRLTEFCGVPGVGKTQLAIQLAVDVQIPFLFGGAQGQTVYIDTEGSFMVQRAAEIAQALVDHLRRMTRGSDHTAAEQSTAAALDRDQLLSHIHCFRVASADEQLSVVNTLDAFLVQNPAVRLIVLDSVAFHFRQCTDKDMPRRARLLSHMAQKLSTLAERHNLAVVLINQVTTRLAGGGSYLTPALGDSWGHAATNRVVLFWRDGQRFAHILKSPTAAEATVPFRVCAEGVRDVALKAPAPPVIPPESLFTWEEEAMLGDEWDWAGVEGKRVAVVELDGQPAEKRPNQAS